MPPPCRVEIFLLRFDTPAKLEVATEVHTLERDMEPDALARMAARARGEPHGDPFVHSTSWRYEEGAIVLTYLAVLETLAGPGRRWLELADLRRSAEELPTREGDPRTAAVLWHGLRHISLLLDERPSEFGARLPAQARRGLERLAPAPATKADRD